MTKEIEIRYRDSDAEKTFRMTLRASVATFVHFRQDFGKSLTKALSDYKDDFDETLGAKLAYEMAVPEVRKTSGFEQFCEGIPPEAVLPLLKETVSLISGAMEPGEGRPLPEAVATAKEGL